MSRPRSKSTSSLPGNIMASWSIFSYPARPVDHTAENASIDKSSSETVQLSHEKPIMENPQRCTSALEIRTSVSSSPSGNSPSPAIGTKPRSRSYTTSSLPRNLMASWSIHSKPSLPAVEDFGPEVHSPSVRQSTYKEQTEENCQIPPPTSVIRPHTMNLMPGPPALSAQYQMSPCHSPTHPPPPGVFTMNRSPH